MKQLTCRRFKCNVWLTHHAEMMMLERKVSEAELMELVETGDIKRKSEIHWWFYKEFPEWIDNLVCAAVQKGDALIVKTVMIDWRLEEKIMQIIYYEEDEILFIKFNDKPILRDVSHGWNVNIGYTAQGIVEITLLDAKAAGLLPIVMDSASVAQIALAA